ncbi:MAG: hypothetical protein JWM99_4821, partial [Verrucomicrobiales bacterium]|nr:hypothetical protein [Verrucomicrobiales bacterium]
MKSPRHDHQAISPRLYAKLLRFHPKSFRDLFGDQMNQLFREQYRDALKLGRAALVGFWIRIFSDFFQTAVREHWNNIIKDNMNTPFEALFRKPKISFKKIFFTILLTCIAILSIKIALEPRIYQSIARFEISRTGVTEDKDPYFIETEIAKITSRSVLERTIGTSGLERTLERQSHHATTPEEQYGFLRDSVNARRSPNTSL